MATDISLDELLTAQTEVTENEDGSVDVDFLHAEDDTAEIITDHYDNLVVYLNESELGELASDVIDGMEEDDMSRKGHLEDLIRGIENLGLNDDNVEVPFDGACTVFHPLIMENAVKIQAKAEGELLPARGPVSLSLIHI